MAFIEDSGTAKNYSKNNQAGDFLRHWLLQTPGEENIKIKKRIFYNLLGIIFLFSAIYRFTFCLYSVDSVVFIVLFLLSLTNLLKRGMMNL